MALVTLDDTKNYLQIALIDATYDTFLNTQILFYSATIEGYCKRVFEDTTHTQEFYMDLHDSNMSRKQLWGAFFPIISVASVTELVTINGIDVPTVIDPQEYRINNKLGKIEKFSSYGVREHWFNGMSNSNFSRIEVIYNGGYAEIPLEIQNTMFQLIEQDYNKRKSGIALSFGNDVQRLSVPGVMSIDFDYTLTNNERNSKYGMFLKGYANVLDMFRSERAVLGAIKDEYVS